MTSQGAGGALYRRQSCSLSIVRFMLAWLEWSTAVWRKVQEGFRDVSGKSTAQCAPTLSLLSNTDKLAVKAENIIPLLSLHSQGAVAGTADAAIATCMALGLWASVEGCLLIG